jgi:glycosyltransferase involved in cell wall biosynthesis
MRCSRILFLNQYLPPDVAATAKRLADLAEDLSVDHDIWILAGRPSYNPGAESFGHPRVRVVRVRSLSLARTSMAGRALNYFSFLASALVRVWSVPRPDVVVAMTDPPVIGLIGVLVAKRHRAPFVQVYMDLYPDIAVALHRADNLVLVWLWNRLNRLVRSTAVRIVVVGRDMRERLLAQGVPPDKIVVRPNWSSQPKATLADVEAVREGMGWTSRSVVMFAGNLGLAQGLDTMIDAAARLRLHQEILFVLVGDGAAKAGLRRMAEALGLSNVVFYPYRPHEEAEVLAAAADMHVISLARGLLGTATPGKVYEIMAAGKPFVAAVQDGSEIARLVDQYGCGVRVDPGDGAALADAILALDGGDGSDMGRRGREAFESTFRREIATAAYRDLLEQVARGDLPDTAPR